MGRKPVIAVTLGDPGGIGPEIVAALFARFRPVRSVGLIVGAFPVFEKEAARAAGARGRALVGRTPVVTARTLRETLRGGRRSIVFVDTGCRERFPVGRDSRGGGKHAYAALELACILAREGVADAIVTAPLSKRSLDLAGYPFTGHTEVLSRFFDAPDCQMLMVYKNFRVAPLSRHLPLKDVSAFITRGRVVRGIGVIDRALRADFGLRNPRIGVAGLNPHAGEDGVLGNEELRTIEPALRTLRARGVLVTGPEPADALFQRAGPGTFDAFVAMYHDQGLVPFKMTAKKRGVNVTVGLPTVRTSVDHGVAFDIAGKGLASVASLREAYRLAEKLARRRISTRARAS